MTAHPVHSQRLRLTRRASPLHLPPFVLTKRDGWVIQAVAQFRALTTVQVARLLFPASRAQPGRVSSRCLNRLKLLYHHGYLERLEQPQVLSEGRKPLMYFLDQRGAQYLTTLFGAQPDWYKADNRLSYPFLEHLMRLNDIRIAITLSASRQGYSVEPWIDDRTLRSPQMKDTVMVKQAGRAASQTAIVPDAYFSLIIPTPDEQESERIYHHFVECDLGSMTAQASVWGRRDFRHKILAYTAYYNSGKYTARYQAKNLKVLTITTSEARLHTLKQVTEGAGGKGRFWFTTFARMAAADVLTNAVWNVASKTGSFALTAAPYGRAGESANREYKTVG